VHGGPRGLAAWSLEQYLRTYRDRLLSGQPGHDERGSVRR
jgi:hypothetical protein